MPVVLIQVSFSWWTRLWINMISKYLIMLYLTHHPVECKNAVQSSVLASGLCSFPHLPEGYLEAWYRNAGGSPLTAAQAGWLYSPWHCGGCSQYPGSQWETHKWTKLILVLVTWNLQTAWAPDSESSACTKSSAHQPRKSMRRRLQLDDPVIRSNSSWAAKDMWQGQREVSWVFMGLDSLYRCMCCLWEYLKDCKSEKMKS